MILACKPISFGTNQNEFVAKLSGRKTLANALPAGATSAGTTCWDTARRDSMPAHTARRRVLHAGAHCAPVQTSRPRTPVASDNCADGAQSTPKLGASAQRAPALIAWHMTAHIARQCILRQRLLCASWHMTAHTCQYAVCRGMCWRRPCAGELCTLEDSASQSIQWQIPLAGAYAASNRHRRTPKCVGRLAMCAGDQSHALHALHCSCT